MKRNLKESTSTIEVIVSKCLGSAKLRPSDLEETRHITHADLMEDYGLDSLLAEKVMTHLNSERLRQKAQSLQTWEIDSRDIKKDPVRHISPTNPIRESSVNKKDLIVELEDIMDLEVDSHLDHIPNSNDGKMLDYGHVKSDSNEGRMMRQALYEISEYSSELHEMLSDNDDVPQWCHYKVAVARACIGKVKHYLEYKIKHPKQK